jgi:hypothetical protein
MAPQDGQSDAYLGAREAALSWLNANWDPALTVRAWWARLADSGWALPTWPTAEHDKRARQARDPGGLHGT